ncbi:MAG: aminoacyl-tRNA hydrolase [Bacteroidetes bacterium]|nr:aminoacyl-tRNA hydrolase [Bacteroidota bacterium]MBS1977265.1 aminoacyl-tRNA hydrolase [Bacteroidota bacterium]
MDPIRIAQLRQELVFSVSRSSGPGGQHVNKTNSKVTGTLHVSQLSFLGPEEKDRLSNFLGNRLTREGLLSISSQRHRSQHDNREEVIRKFESLITKGLTVRKKRKATRPTKASVTRRLESKRRKGEKKQWRRTDL